MEVEVIVDECQSFQSAAVGVCVNVLVLGGWGGGGVPACVLEDEGRAPEGPGVGAVGWSQCSCAGVMVLVVFAFP